MRIVWVIPNGMLYGGIKKVLEIANGTIINNDDMYLCIRDFKFDFRKWFEPYFNVPVITEKELHNVVNENTLMILTWKGDVDLAGLNGSESLFFCQDVNHENQNDDLDKLINVSDSIVCTSDYLINYLKDNYKERKSKIIHKIQCGIDLDVFHPPYNSDKNKKMAMYIPRKTKGSKIIEPIWNSKDRFARLYAFGGMPSGHYGDGSSLIRPSALAAKYRRSNIFITASPSEPFGLTPLEAMACGCIVVGWDGHGGKEYMEDGVNAIVADNADVDSLSEKIDRVDWLLRNRPQRLEDIRNNAIATSTKFSLIKEANNWNEYFSRRRSNQI